MLYKLDPSIDHILLDEAQDTNPRQWEIVTQLTQEFFAGKGARETTHRSLFVVGDEKQSIYSFQGVRPETFSDQLVRLSADVQLETVILNQSFRSARAILEAVDTVFSSEANSAGLGSKSDVLHHFPHRSDWGSVEVWDILPKADKPDFNIWQSAVENYVPPIQSPAIILAQKVAERIKQWIEQKKLITAKDGVRPVHAGDFLILVRMRDEFFSALVRALKNCAVPVSGADRLVLSRHIAVQDLIALGRVMITPQDDLSLASLLKSPLFNLTEDDLATLAIGRKNHLWFALKTSQEKKFTDIFTKLSAWQVLAQSLPTYEFLRPRSRSRRWSPQFLRPSWL